MKDKRIVITHRGEDYIKVEVGVHPDSVEYEVTYPAAAIIDELARRFDIAYTAVLNIEKIMKND